MTAGISGSVRQARARHSCQRSGRASGRVLFPDRADSVLPCQWTFQQWRRRPGL